MLLEHKAALCFVQPVPLSIGKADSKEPIWAWAYAILWYFVVPHKSLRYGTGVRSPLSIGVFGGVSPAGLDRAIEAFGAFAALSRCGAVHNGGPFMGIQANEFLRRNGHCSQKLLWVRPSFRAASCSERVSFYRAEPNPLPAFITLHPAQWEWEGCAAEFILFSEMPWGEWSELAVPHVWRRVPRRGNQKRGEQQWPFCDSTGSGQRLGGPHWAVHLLLQPHADGRERDRGQTHLHLRARWVAWVPPDQACPVLPVNCMKVFRSIKIINIYQRKFENYKHTSLNQDHLSCDHPEIFIVNILELY